MFYPSDNNFIKSVSHIDKNNFQGFSSNAIDTSINGFQNYFPRNTSGIPGLPSAPLFINYNVKPLGFYLLDPVYNQDMISSDNVRYYQTKGPYASLTGIAGTKQEQVFKLLFSHSFKNKLNLSLGFNRYGTIGFYDHQQAYTNNFYTGSNFTAKNGRVGYYAYFLFNKVKHQENGGLANDSLFLENININKKLLPVNLTSARREFRRSNVNANTWFRLNKKEDSLTAFSHFIDYTINYSGNYTKYFDLSSGSNSYYPMYYTDTVSTNDSTKWRTIANQVNYILKLNKLNTKVNLGYKHEYNQVHQYYDSVFSNQLINAGIFTKQKNYTAFVKGEYIFSGANANDYLVEMNNKLELHFPWSILKQGDNQLFFYLNLDASVEKRHPNFIYNHWFSNHYQWQNSFSPIDKQQAKLSFSTSDNRFEVGFVFQNIKNYIYFNDISLPAQTSVSIQNISAFIRKDILLWNHLGLNVGYVFQQSSYPTIVSVPQQIGSGALYYQGNLFKKALQLQIGFSGQYYSSFYGYAYNPMLNQYNVQTTKLVGNYPFVDFFINARIKPVRVFLKIDHVTQGMLGGNYSLTPGYLQPDRAFKFGLNWLFFD